MFHIHIDFVYSKKQLQQSMLSEDKGQDPPIEFVTSPGEETEKTESEHPSHNPSHQGRRWHTEKQNLP